MALANYGNLKTEVGDWMGRTDLVSTKVPDFIAMTTARLNRTLRCREMLSDEADLAFTNGLATIPADFLQIDYLRDPATGRQVLSNVSAPGGFQTYSPGYQGSQLYAYSVLGAQIQAYPAITATVKWRYYKQVPAFTNDASTNWVLTKHPDLYLYGAILAGRAHVNADSIDLAAVKQGYDEALAEVANDAINQEWAAANVNQTATRRVI